jgi:hypothetical protein
MKLTEFSINALKETITGDNGLTPYLSGSNLVKLFNQFGFRDTYSWQGGGLPGELSRNPYTFERLKELNGSKNLKLLFEKIVSMRHFASYQKENVEPAITHINDIIKYEGYRFEKIDDIYRIIGTDKEEDKNEVDIYFEDIQGKIVEQIKLAKFIIWIAVAWFTDKELFKLLVVKKNEGLNVQLIVIGDEINRQSGFHYENEF